MPQVQITRKISETQKSGSVVLQILDINGATIAGADVALVESGPETNGSAKQVANTTNAEGGVEFSALRKGNYDLTIKHPGFTDFAMQKVNVDSNELVSVNIILAFAAGYATVGVVDLPLMTIEKPIGTTIITREMIDRLPF